MKRATQAMSPTRQSSRYDGGASQDDGLNSIVFDDDLVNEDEADRSVDLKWLGGEVGSTVNSMRVISDGNPANDATQPPRGSNDDGERDNGQECQVKILGLADGTDGDHERDR
ncbi:hypothetical protein BCU64_025710 [Vibrio lentus]